MNKSFVDACVDVNLSKTLVYGPGIEPFYNGVSKFTKGLTNQQSGIIGAIVMSSSYLQESNRKVNELDGGDYKNEILTNMYELNVAKRYLEQALILLMSDAGSKWKEIASAYVNAMYYFVEESKLNEIEFTQVVNDLNPNGLEIDYDFIESVQQKKDRKNRGL
ncbi:hypothetical protein V6238_07090 [Marinomonas arenicola]|uniref:hypothetical protein n=1 Tax=Marinomonas arenicola TaxID=569601 RepID=UPI0031200E07